MSSAVVIGATSFVGFHLCETLISKEYDVLAVDPVEKIGENEEEKIMAIGRNAFFQYSLLKDAQPRHSEIEYEVAFICTDKDWSVEEEEFIYSLSKIVNKIIIVSDATTRHSLVNTIKNAILVVLPETFGPWQPLTSPIERAIYNEVANEEQDVEAIEKKDYIYVKNVTEALTALWEEDVQEKVLYVTSDEENSWDIISQLLNITVKEGDPIIFEEDKIIWDFISYRPTVPIKEGIDLQKRFDMVKLRNKRIIE